MAKQDKHPFQAITPVDPNYTPIRQECKEWMKNNQIQVSLYIRALTNWYNTINYNDDTGLSYYEIAGIHGLPSDHEWNSGGLPGPKVHPPDLHGYKYCAHNVVTFPTWHRPYMLLFEKRMYDEIQKVVTDLISAKIFKSDDVKNDWIAEANNFRLPYWDWGLSGATVPSMFTDDPISIVNPDGPNSNWTPNPLTRFGLPETATGEQLTFGTLDGKFKVVTGEKSPPWGSYYGTSRYGNRSAAGVNRLRGVNNWSFINSTLEAAPWYRRKDVDPKLMKPNPISDYVCRLLSYGTEWRYFASTQDRFDLNVTASKSWQDYISLEYIHNNLHVWIGEGGGSGQMSDPAVAAFDPIFFNHHCNIDRYFAIWQTLHPGIWFQTDDSPGPTDDLNPFFYDDNTFWNSNATRDWTALGYQYDILQPAGKAETNNDRRIRVAALVKKNYPATGEFLAAPFNEHFLGPEPEPFADPSTFAQEGFSGGFSDSAAPDADQGEPSLASSQEEGEQRQAPAQTLEAQQPVAIQKSHVAPAPLPQLLAENAERKAGSGGVKKHRRLFPDYIVNILYDRYALNGHPYSIYVFLGEVTDDDLTSATMNIHHPNYAGMVYTFTTNWLDTCPNCASQAKEKQLSRAHVPLTLPLLRHAINPDYTAINHMDHHTVEEYLVKHLTWRAVDGDGNPISMDRLPRTRIFALKGRAHHYHDEPERLSEYFGYQPMSGATDGKHGGARHHHYDSPADGLF